MSMTTKEMIAVMQAFDEGKTIEYADATGPSAGMWNTTNYPSWNWHSNQYRVKPEPVELYVVGYTFDGGNERYLAPRSLQSAEQTVRMYLETGFKKARVIKMREVLDES